MSRLQDKTLRNAVEYLESIGLAVYGPCMDLDTGFAYGAQMDYDADRVMKYRKLKEEQPDIPYYPDEG